MDDVKLSLRQIEKMEHAIGFERGKIKRNKYKVYRNWYIVNHPHFLVGIRLWVLSCLCCQWHYIM